MNSTLMNKDLFKKIGRETLLNLVREHKLNCHDEFCDVHLMPLLLWLELEGIIFSKEEKEMFL